MERSTGTAKKQFKMTKKRLQVFEEEYSLPDLVEGLPELAWAYVDEGQLENGLSMAIRACALSEYARSLDRQDVAILFCLFYSSSVDSEMKPNKPLRGIQDSRENY